MRRLISLLAVASLLVISLPVHSALPPAPVEHGMIFGGQWAHANNTSASVTNLTDLPAVVEVYTATWCENCVDVEHGLDDVQAEGALQQYHIHRAVGESQDPFGQEYLDYRWKNRYGATSITNGQQPPGVVFNGTMMKEGSVTDEASLYVEFFNMANQSLGLGDGSTSFSWTPNGTQSGTVTWALTIDDSHLENATLEVTAWVVEAGANFEEGTNGLGTYPHILRDIVFLGEERQGTALIGLPEPFDGNDLEVHLIYQVIPIVEDEEEVIEPNEGEDTPSLSFVATTAAIMMAVISRREY